MTGRHVDPVAPFVPAKVTDNKHIDQEQYIESLNMLHPTVRAQLLEGDWNARDGLGLTHLAARDGGYRPSAPDPRLQV